MKLKNNRAMKKFYIIFALLISFSFSIYGQTSLPFLGTRYFNYVNGTCCNESITIFKDGSCIIKGYPAPIFEDKSSTIFYKGKFKSIIWFYKNGKKEHGYKFVHNSMYLINKNGKISIGKFGNANEPDMSILTKTLY